ncbi:hypothetical protein [[Enterobacter] lignolyticus]|uniref:Uncharacterized protein n=1 Tax=Enterobacter lignolyticus (strain SCF1) TaxID=701347 RepID=E3G835_ENTLS|nr:hypothetical protein [[Enterobacter] lignolyticus]ADO48623.1 hypothetical protein Entcl_2372 [[Enterobacter] lignolyticus SCF1]
MKKGILGVTMLVMGLSFTSAAGDTRLSEQQLADMWLRADKAERNGKDAQAISAWIKSDYGDQAVTEWGEPIAVIESIEIHADETSVQSAKATLRSAVAGGDAKTIERKNDVLQSIEKVGGTGIPVCYVVANTRARTLSSANAITHGDTCEDIAAGIAAEMIGRAPKAKLKVVVNGRPL